jgi:pyrimidine-nucleoside phosphorylase
MVEIGNADGKKTIAVITDMNQPLGLAVGNSLEVIEAIETLKGKGPKDITELSLTLASYMIYAAEKTASPEEGYQMAIQALESGAALKKLADFIEGQGGDPNVIDDHTLFLSPQCKTEIHAETDGYVGAIEARSIGLASQHSGAGRATKEDSIDLSAGIMLAKKVGDTVRKGDLLATVYGNDQSKVDLGAKEAARAFFIQDSKPEEAALIKKVIQ